MRGVFPDAFVDRLTQYGIEDRFKKILEKSQSHLAAIYFDLDGGNEIDRYGENDLYQLSIYLVHTIDPDVVAAETAAQAAKSHIDDLFARRCKRTAIGSVFNWKAATYIQRLRLHYLSWKGSKNGMPTTLAYECSRHVQ